MPVRSEEARDVRSLAIHGRLEIRRILSVISTASVSNGVVDSVPLLNLLDCMKLKHYAGTEVMPSHRRLNGAS